MPSLRKTAYTYLILFLFSGCSLIQVSKEYYKRDIGSIPTEKKLSFESKEALAVGATLQNRTAADVFYKGSKPESKESKILYDMSYRFMALAGVNSSFDPSDPASIEKVFKQADNALLEKDKVIHDLQQSVADFNNRLASKEMAIKDKETELGGWKTSFSNLKTAFYGIISFAIIGMIGLLVAQIFTGIPFFTGALGGIRTLFKAVKQTASGLDDVKSKIRGMIGNGATEEEKRAYGKALDIMRTTLGEYQDESVKKLITKKIGANKQEPHEGKTVCRPKRS